MKVYHGSYTAIEEIDFSFCRKRRDFGRGFYVTKFLSQAEYWAARKGEDNDIVKSLIVDYGISEMNATEMYYKSNTYRNLANESSNYYKKTWIEIYEMLKKELKI